MQNKSRLSHFLANIILSASHKVLSANSMTLLASRGLCVLSASFQLFLRKKKVRMADETLTLASAQPGNHLRELMNVNPSL